MCKQCFDSHQTAEPEHLFLQVRKLHNDKVIRVCDLQKVMHEDDYSDIQFAGARVDGETSSYRRNSRKGPAHRAPFY
ncbi:hypothetical protein SESBI_13793 [Sesbania bispinosa]|nr:hypothetical protein SESBI_13793 [Sesbania bispinosa]